MFISCAHPLALAGNCRARACMRRGGPEPTRARSRSRRALSHNHARAMDGLDCAHARSGTASWTLAPGRPYLTCAPLLRLLPMAAGPSCGAALHSRRREHPDGVAGVVGVVGRRGGIRRPRAERDCNHESRYSRCANHADDDEFPSNPAHSTPRRPLGSYCPHPSRQIPVDTGDLRPDPIGCPRHLLCPLRVAGVEGSGGVSGAHHVPILSSATGLLWSE